MKYYSVGENEIKVGPLKSHFLVCYFLAVMINEFKKLI